MFFFSSSVKPYISTPHPTPKPKPLAPPPSLFGPDTSPDVSMKPVLVRALVEFGGTGAVWKQAVIYGLGLCDRLKRDIIMSGA